VKKNIRTLAAALLIVALPSVHAIDPAAVQK
jgi:hypothetical protein